MTLTLAGCVTRPESFEHSAGPLVLERDFAGRNYASGSFTNSITGLRRDFKVALDGARRGDTFLRSERFNYADGQKDVKTWRFEKIGDGLYRGTREDVAGIAEVTKDGDAIRLSYDVDLPSIGGTTRVHIEDVLDAH